MNYFEKIITFNNNKWAMLKSSEGKILIEGRNSPNFMIPFSIIARLLNEKKGYEPIVIVKSNKDAVLEKWFKSFKIKSFVFIKNYVIKNPHIFIKSFINATISFVRLVNDNYDYCNFINNYKVKNILIGDLIYDSFIRDNNKYSNLNKHKMYFYKLLIRSLILFYFCHYIIKKNNIKCVVVSEWVYASLNSFLTRIALYNKIKVIMTKGTFIQIYNSYEDCFYNPLKPTAAILDNIRTKNILNVVDEYISKRYQGEIDQYDVINAYRNKKMWTKKEIVKYYELNNINKTIVFLMPHCFSDANHSSKMLFRDYYEWFIETIEFIKHLDNIFWLVKPHPSSHMFGEQGEVENIIKKLNKKHIKLVPSNLNTASIFNIGRTLVTVRGTVGLEAACSGMKPILAGQAIYSHFGFTCDPKSKEEYYKLLINIENIKKLNKKQIEKAKKVLYWYHIGSRVNSDIMKSNLILFPGMGHKEKEKAINNIYKNLYYYIRKNGYESDNFYKKIEHFIEAEESL